MNALKGNDNFSEKNETDNSARFFINIGKKDGYDWMRLKDFLRDSLELGQDAVFKVDVKDSFSFFNTETVHMPKVLEFFSDFKQNGRYINVEITEKQDRSRQRRKGKRRNDSQKSHGNFSKGRNRRSSDFKQGLGHSRPRINRRR